MDQKEKKLLKNLAFWNKDLSKAEDFDQISCSGCVEACSSCGD